MTGRIMTVLMGGDCDDRRSMVVLMGGVCDDGADHDSVNGRGL